MKRYGWTVIGIVCATAVLPARGGEPYEVEALREAMRARGKTWAPPEMRLPPADPRMPDRGVWRGGPVGPPPPPPPRPPAPPERAIGVHPAPPHGCPGYPWLVMYGGVRIGSDPWAAGLIVRVLTPWRRLCQPRVHGHPALIQEWCPWRGQWQTIGLHPSIW